jgi:hypothetical protein
MITTRRLYEVLKLTGVTLWLGATCWIFQSHFTQRAEAARESVWRSRTEAVLARPALAVRSPKAIVIAAGSRLAERELEAVRLQGSRVVVDPQGSPAKAADSIDHTVRHIGLAQVAISPEDPRALYWVVFELARRGYDEGELLTLLGQREAGAELRTSLAAGGGC